MRDERVLVLKRSNKVGTFQGKWAAVSGFIESYPQSQSLLEIKEETGLESSDVELLRAGLPFEVEDEENNVLWVIHPYLYKVKSQKDIRIDSEHFEYEWIDPVDLSKYDTVPGLQEALERVMYDEE
jgi:8-oxo-dGTP pyrophosphatase MutT (NUDIX family)